MARRLAVGPYVLDAVIAGFVTASGQPWRHYALFEAHPVVFFVFVVLVGPLNFGLGFSIGCNHVVSAGGTGTTSGYAAGAEF